MELGSKTTTGTSTAPTSLPQTAETSRLGLSRPRNSGTTSTTIKVAPVNALVNTGWQRPNGTPRPRRAVVLCVGDWKQGKTHFALTAAKLGPLRFQSLDLGTEGVIEKFPTDLPNIQLAEYSLTVQPGQASETEVAIAADKVWQQFCADYYEALNDPSCRTIVWDTESEVWELLRLARFGVLNPKTGRDRGNVWGPVNAEMLGMIRAAMGTDKNLIMLEKVKDEYANDKKTGKRERKGFSDAAFQAQIIVRARRDQTEGFVLDITDCRGNPDLAGVSIPNDMETLLTMIFV